MAKLLKYVGSKLCYFPGVPSATELSLGDDGSLVISGVTNGSTTTIKVNLYDADVVANANNADLYENLKEAVKENRVTEMTKMGDTFKVFIDCVIYDAKKKIIEEGVKIHEIKATDAVRLLNVDSNNHCDYVHEKIFNMKLPFHFPVMRTGIVQQRQVPKYVRIRNIAIMAELPSCENTNGIKKLNQTLLDHTISPLSPTIETARENRVEIFNSYAFDLGVIGLEKNVSTIELDIHVALGGFVNVYDGGIELDTIFEEVKQIIEEENNQPEDNPQNPDKPGDEDNKPDNPDDSFDDGGFYFESFERCPANYAKAGLVVSDEDYANDVYSDRLVYAYSDVVKDIADIQIGEYVKYVESIEIFNL